MVRLVDSSGVSHVNLTKQWWTLKRTPSVGDRFVLFARHGEPVCVTVEIVLTDEGVLNVYTRTHYEWYSAFIDRGFSRVAA